MKKIQLLLIALILSSLGLTQQTAGQTKYIRSSELEELISKADNFRYGQAHTRESITEYFEKDGTVLKRKTVEINKSRPPGRNYRSFTLISDGVEQKNESIRIGQTFYHRYNYGTWKIQDFSGRGGGIGTGPPPPPPPAPPPPGGGIGSGNKTIITPELTMFHGTEKIGDKTARVYENWDKITYSDGEEISRTYKYWFDEDGKYLKTFYKGRNPEKDLTEIRTTTFDYDSEINIENPIETKDGEANGPTAVSREEYDRVYRTAVDVFAQRRTFTAEDLKILESTAEAKLKTLVYRKTTETENSDRTTRTVYEQLSPERRRLYIERKGEDSISRDEWIYIGESTFHRKDQGAWKLLEKTNSGSGSGSGFGSGFGSAPKITVEYNLWPDRKIGKNETDLYEVVTTVTFDTGYSEYTDVYRKRVWLAKDGRLIRTENENRYGRSGKSYTTNIVYEYDPDLQIEAPVVK